MKLSLYLGILAVVLLVNNVQSEAIQLNGGNFNNVVGQSELVFINFYASWCRFSNMLDPIWNEFAKKAQSMYNPNQVLIAKVDADMEKIIAANNGINKYPTLKMYRYGVLVKKEYRGARNVPAFLEYLKDQMTSKLKVVETRPDYMSIDYSKPTVIGFFSNRDSHGFKTFEKLSSLLRDKAEFVAGVGSMLADEMRNGERVFYRESDSDDNDAKNIFNGDVSNYEQVYAWAHDRCTPTVRTITFENAEELTENGLPFLILFHKPGETESIKVFEAEVKRQLQGHLMGTILPVAADGQMFSHPLHHLGKTINDLPLVAIDSFKHMYVFPSNQKYTEGENLKQFVMDLNTGKLHREFHNGPDPAGIEMVPNVQFEIVVNTDANHVPKIPEIKPQEVRTAPPESAFVKLAPSQDRYSVRHGDGGEF